MPYLYRFCLVRLVGGLTKKCGWAAVEKSAGISLVLDLSADCGSRGRFRGAQVPFVVEDGGAGYPAVGKVVQTVIPAFVAGGTDQMGIARFSSGMKTARIDAAQVDRFAAQRVARLSAGRAT